MIHRKLKIVHVSTHITGGAGSAAYRIHNALQPFTDSTFLTFDESSDLSVKKLSFQFKPIGQRIKKKCVDFLSQKQRKRNRLQNEFLEIMPKLKCGFASLPFSNYDILTSPQVMEADIIHLHWVAGIFDYTTFFKKNKKPVVWTMHDMSPIKGLFHYDDDETRNEVLAGNLNKRVFELKKASIADRRCILRWIAPSIWLQREVASSEIYQNIRGYRIYNGINCNVFKPSDTTALRQKLEIPKYQTILLFVAENINDYRKGFDLLLEALTGLTGINITLLIIGKIQISFETSARVIALGAIYDEQLLSEYFSLTDAFIIASREDNLPNVMVEAMCCGTPVLSFNTGGMATVIEDYVNGLKAAEISAAGLRNIIQEFIRNKERFNPVIIRQFAEKAFGQQHIVRQYLEVYHEIMNSTE